MPCMLHPKKVFSLLGLYVASTTTCVLILILPDILNLCSLSEKGSICTGLHILSFECKLDLSGLHLVGVWFATLKCEMFVFFAAMSHKSLKRCGYL
jgi:hypothetical protein